jgi:hypothetical protein
MPDLAGPPPHAASPPHAHAARGGGGGGPGGGLGGGRSGSPPAGRHRVSWAGGATSPVGGGSGGAARGGGCAQPPRARVFLTSVEPPPSVGGYGSGGGYDSPGDAESGGRSHRSSCNGGESYSYGCGAPPRAATADGYSVPGEAEGDGGGTTEAARGAWPWPSPHGAPRAARAPSQVRGGRGRFAASVACACHAQTAAELYMIALHCCWGALRPRAVGHVDAAKGCARVVCLAASTPTTSDARPGARCPATLCHRCSVAVDRNGGAIGRAARRPLPHSS